MRICKNELLIILLSALVLTAGCTSDEARSVAMTQEGIEDASTPDTDLFGAEVTFSRKVSKKSGRPIGAGTVFEMTTRSYVNALVDFTNVHQGRTYVVHLVWVRPDGKKIFMKYAEVLQNPDADSGHQTVVSWLKAIDLHDVKRDTLNSDTPAFTLDTRLNISTKKNRVPGTYMFQVYLDRRLLLEKEFLVEGDFPVESDI